MKLSVRSLTVLSLWALILFAAVIARADINGSVSDIVTDPSGAVIPFATSTNVQHTTITDGHEFFAFPALPVDHSTITLSQPGYDQFLAHGIVINAN